MKPPPPSLIGPGLGRIVGSTAMVAAMVLCAGLGTRLRPITDHIPKPLVPIGDRSALEHIVDQLRAARLAPLVMNTHHRADAFQGALAEAIAVIHEPTILGTAGGVANAAALLGPGTIVVWNGDIAARPDLEHLLAQHGASASCATLLAVQRPAGEGTLGVGDDGAIARLRGERFGPELLGADFIGIQVLSQRARDVLPKVGCLVGDGYLPLLRQGERIQVAWHRGDWADIGSAASLLDANLRWLERSGAVAWISPKAIVDHGVTVARSVVCAGARIKGEGLVDDCLVLPGATLHAPAQGCVALADGRSVPARS